MIFREYVSVYGYPDKVLVRLPDRYDQIQFSYFDDPDVQRLKVDHVELNEAYPDRTVVFLRSNGVAV